MGRLSGQYFFRTPTGIIGNYLDPLQNQPYIHGERISFKPTRNFEFGVTRTVLFGGGDIPMTLGYFVGSLFDRGEHNAVKGTAHDPGKQDSGLDWNYRLPLLRRWVSFYGDAFAWDQLSPIAYWIVPGLVQDCIFRTFRNFRNSISASRVCTPMFPRGRHRSRLLLFEWLQPLPGRLHERRKSDWQLDRARRAGCAGMDQLLVHAPKSDPGQFRHEKVASSLFPGVAH